MQTLTRSSGETIRSGDDIEATVTGVAANQVRIAIGVPLDVPVHREEICPQLVDGR